MTVEKALVAALMTIVVALLGAFVALGAAGFFDPIPANGPRPCPAVWRADCEAAR